MNFVRKYRADRVNWVPSYEAISSLSRFGLQAKPAVPILSGLLNGPEEAIRDAATHALRSIDPDAAANAGVQ